MRRERDVWVNMRAGEGWLAEERGWGEDEEHEEEEEEEVKGEEGEEDVAEDGSVFAPLDSTQITLPPLARW